MASSEARLGPLVHRAVHHAAIVWIVAAIGFVVAMGIVQTQFTGYSLSTNQISDLGNTQCADFPAGSSHYVCSPWHLGFEIAVIAFGLLVILGALLVRSAFPDRSTRSLGLLLLILGGVGAIGVGLFPENVNHRVHDLVALLAFAGGNLSLLVLGFAMFRDTRWDGYRAFTMFVGLIGLVALVLYATGVDLGLGSGGMERLIVAPLLLWMVVVSVHLLRIPTYAPRIVPKASGV